MTVTEIQPVSRMKMRIFLDGESAFVISPALVHKWDLHEGKTLDAEQERLLMHQACMYAARTAVELLAGREYTAHDLRQRLRRREFAPRFIDFAIDYVQDKHYQDDLRFAQSYIRAHEGKYSRLQIRLKLQQKGVSEDLIAQALNGAEYDDAYSLQTEFDKRFRQADSLPAITDPPAQKFIRSMVRKGYQYRDVIELFRLRKE